MTILDAAEQVLREAGGGPLHLREITQRMLLKGWTTRAETPWWSTVGTSLADDVKDRGASSRFVRVRKGEYGLNPNRTSTGTVRGSALENPTGDSAHPKR